MTAISRRQYLRSLFSNAMEAVDELRGEAHFRLDQIDSLPDSTVRAMTPVPFQGSTLCVEDGWLVVEKDSGTARERVMPLSAPQQYAVERFDGRHSIANICAATESAFGITPDSAGELVRSLFLTLARKGICHPLDRPE